MNRQPILDSWASGELVGNSEQFARVGIELSGNTGWFALAPAAQILPRGGRPRHATGELSRRPSQLSRRPAGLAGLTDESAGLTGHPAGPPGELAGRPGRLSRRPAGPDGRPSEPDGPGAARRRGMAARRRPGAVPREGTDAPGRGMYGPRRPGVRALARAVFVPEGRRGVATGGGRRRRPEPVDRTRADGFCPGGAEGSNDRGMMPNSSAPAGAGTHLRPSSTGCVGEAPTPPVATALDPSGVEEGALVFAGEVPEGRHAPLASAGLLAGGGTHAQA